MTKNRKTIIIGGVAGGASCAARLSRLDAKRKIIILERGEYISYANCGLPYHISDVIHNRDALLLMTPEVMWNRFNIEVRVKNEVIAINREKKVVVVKKLDTGKIYEESYDDLVIATGSSPLRPRIPGIDNDKIKSLWTVPDTDEIRALVHKDNVNNVTVIGGGFIGLEMTENLRHIGKTVTLVEAADQVMAPLDFEMAQIVHQHLRENGVTLHLNDGVDSFEEKADKIIIKLKSGKTISSDLALLSIGVRPNSLLAKESGLKLNEKGGIVVNSSMQTSDPSIYAVGDVIEVDDFIFKNKTMVPLAGPANKQGRILADVLAGRSSTYKGTQGSSVVKVFDLTLASTGVNEKSLINKGLLKGVDYETLIIMQNSHAGYYPGASQLTLKLIFSPKTEQIYGAQIVGREGVDKRIDTIGVAIRLGAKVTELKDLELAYAPPYSSAKDPVNMAGFVAENILTGLVKIAPFDVTMTDPKAFVLDVREEAEVEAYSVPNSKHIPLGELRDRLLELNKRDRIVIMCAIGVRAYIAARILMQNGFKNVEVYPGGVSFYKTNFPTNEEIDFKINSKEENMIQNDKINRIKIDCSGMQCPGPIMEVFKTVNNMQEGELLEVSASDPGFAKDIVSWCKKTGNILVSNEKINNEYIAVIKKGFLEKSPQKDILTVNNSKVKTIIVFDGDMDKVLASFVIANGALAMGRPVTMFFTFWGLNALRKPEKVKTKKSFIEKMFGFMLPRGSRKLKLSKMNMGGIGTKMMRSIMKDKNIDSLEDMMKKALDNGVKIIACSMSMDVMGIKKEELIDGVEIGGVGSYLGDAEESDVNLFI